MHIRTLICGLLAAVATVLVPATAQASLIGDTVNFQCTNCVPPTDDDFVVVDGGPPELSLFDQFTVDVGDSWLRIDWIFDSFGIFSDLDLLWSDLDWVGMAGEIVGVTIDQSSTWNTNGIIDFGPHSVRLTNNGDQTVVVGDFIRLNLETIHAPEPGALALVALGLIGAAGRRRGAGKAR